MKFRRFENMVIYAKPTLDDKSKFIKDVNKVIDAYFEEAIVQPVVVAVDSLPLEWFYYKFDRPVISKIAASITKETGVTLRGEDVAELLNQYLNIPDLGIEVCSKDTLALTVRINLNLMRCKRNLIEITKLYKENPELLEYIDIDYMDIDENDILYNDIRNEFYAVYSKDSSLYCIYKYESDFDYDRIDYDFSCDYQKVIKKCNK